MLRSRSMAARAWQFTRPWQPSLLVKAALTVAACLVVRLVAAQAPAASDVLAPEQVDAQGYKIQTPRDELFKGPKARSIEQGERTNVRQILAGNLNLNADPSTKRRFRAYYQQYLFPLMTTEEGQKTIGADRQSFLRDLLAAKNQEAHTELINLTLPAMQRIIQDPAYRLSSRYNAMLIVSNLNETEPNATSVPQTLPDPMRLALPFILQQYRKADNHDSIKIAALMGLARHLEWDNYRTATPIPAGGRTAMLSDLTALAEAKQAPEGRASDVHSWMRRRALDGLTFAAQTKPDPAVAATLEKLIKDESDTLQVRLAAANALGKISLQPPVKIDTVALAKDLGYLALVACESELARAESHRKTDAEHEARLAGTYSAEIDYSGASGTPGMGGGYGGEGYSGGMSGPGGAASIRRGGPIGGGEIGGDIGGAGMPIDPSMNDPKHYRVDFLRRRLRQHLAAVQVGLAGNDDFIRPRTAGKAAPQGGAPTPTPKASADPASPTEKRGVHSAAKTPPEQEGVKEVYYCVRRLAEVVEVAGAQADFHQLIKDLRQESRPLESMTKRLVPAPAVADAEEGPSRPARGGPGKATPVKAAPAPAAGKGASRPVAPRPQPTVIARPRTAR